MKITQEWLKEKDACSAGVRWFMNQTETDGVKIVDKLIRENKLDWANWLIVRIMSYKQYVSYAVYAAEQVLPIYEKKYPDDKRPHEAIKAAKKCIADPSNKNTKDVAAAANAAFAAAAADAAAAAAVAASAAVYAVASADAAAVAATAAADATSAADAAAAAANAASAAVYAATSVADAAAAAANAASAAVAVAFAASAHADMNKILKYGLKLLVEVSDNREQDNGA